MIVAYDNRDMSGKDFVDMFKGLFYAFRLKSESVNYNNLWGIDTLPRIANIDIIGFTPIPSRTFTVVKTMVIYAYKDIENSPVKPVYNEIKEFVDKTDKTLWNVVIMPFFNDNRRILIIKFRYDYIADSFILSDTIELYAYTTGSLRMSRKITFNPRGL